MLEIQQTLLNLLNTSDSRYSYIAIEKLMLIMLEDYLKKQGKNFIINFTSKNNDCKFDGLAPEGVDNYQGMTAIEIKCYKHERISLNSINSKITQTAMCENNIDHLIFIVLSPFPVSTLHSFIKQKNKYDFKIHIWDINDICKIISMNPNLFSETLANLDSILIRNTISNSVKNTKLTYLEKNKKYIQDLQYAYSKDNLVLFLGAGASKEANVATWDILISSLFVELINKELITEEKTISQKDCERIIKSFVKKENSPLLQARFLRRGLVTDFEDSIRNILYKNSSSTSPLLNELAQLCVPNRGKIGIQAIINYNFDDLIEKNLKELRVKYHSIYAEGMNANNDELGIYHVHGFLPQNPDEYKYLTKSLLVFSEEGYHKLLLEPYNWANISQLNFLNNHCCLFIGLSMTDPNLRRLLEIAAKKQIDGDITCRHYAIMKKERIEGSDTSEGLANFENVNSSLKESIFKELGVNIIWIDDFKEIPKIIRQIKTNSEINV